jgi:DNA-binding transcriptional regulator YdaS (Cro superfamily)
MKQKTTISGIEQAVATVGSQENLAQQLGVTQQAVSLWRKRGWVPPHRAPEIEHITGVHRHTLIKPRLRELLEINP